MVELIRYLQSEINKYNEFENYEDLYGVFRIGDIQRMIEEYIILAYEIEKINKITKKAKKMVGEIDEW